MVEVPVVLIEIDERDGARPCVEVRGNDIEEVVDQVRAAHRRRRTRVFRQGRSRNHPDHLRQGAVRDILFDPLDQRPRTTAVDRAVEQAALGPCQSLSPFVKLAEQPVLLCGRLSGQSLVELLGRPVRAVDLPQRFSADLLERLEVLDRVVGEVIPLLVDLPGDPRVLQPLRVGAPVIPWVILVVGVVGHCAPTGRLLADLSGPEVHPVRIRRPEDRTVVGVEDREGVGKLVLQCDVATIVVRHRPLALVRHPLVVPAIRPCTRGIAKTMRQSTEVLNVARRPAFRRRGLAEGEREYIALHPRLMEDRVPSSSTQRIPIPIPTHTAQRPVVVIEGSILLHQQDHMLDRTHTTGLHRFCERPTHRWRQKRAQRCDSGDGSCGSQHLPPSRSGCRTSWRIFCAI